MEPRKQLVYKRLPNTYEVQFIIIKSLENHLPVLKVGKILFVLTEADLPLFRPSVLEIVDIQQQRSLGNHLPVLKLGKILF